MAIPPRPTALVPPAHAGARTPPADMERVRRARPSRSPAARRRPSSPGGPPPRDFHRSISGRGRRNATDQAAQRPHPKSAADLPIRSRRQQDCASGWGVCRVRPGLTDACGTSAGLESSARVGIGLIVAVRNVCFWGPCSPPQWQLLRAAQDCCGVLSRNDQRRLSARQSGWRWRSSPVAPWRRVRVGRSNGVCRRYGL